MDSGSNSKINSLASRLVSPDNPGGRVAGTCEEDEDEDAIFAELEAEIENDSSAEMRERGLEMFHRKLENLREMQNNYHGQYTEVTDEKEAVRVSARESRCVMHFYHTKFKRCAIMDKHLAKIAPKYFNTRFARVFVENAPWLVVKLKIQVLPCVICFVDGIAKDRLIGFEDLGNSDVFNTAVLERRLARTGVMSAPTENGLSDVFRVTSLRETENRHKDGGDNDDGIDLYE